MAREVSGWLLLNILELMNSIPPLGGHIAKEGYLKRAYVIFLFLFLPARSDSCYKS